MKKRKVITLAIEDSFSSIQRVDDIKTKLESRNYTVELQKIKKPDTSTSKNFTDHIKKQEKFLQKILLVFLFLCFQRLLWLCQI